MQSLSLFDKWFLVRVRIEGIALHQGFPFLSQNNRLVELEKTVTCFGVQIRCFGKGKESLDAKQCLLFWHRLNFKVSSISSRHLLDTHTHTANARTNCVQTNIVTHTRTRTRTFKWLLAHSCMQTHVQTHTRTHQFPQLYLDTYMHTYVRVCVLTSGNNTITNYDNKCYEKVKKYVVP